jgi:hypothetical protein
VENLDYSEDEEYILNEWSEFVKLHSGTKVFTPDNIPEEFYSRYALYSMVKEMFPEMATEIATYGGNELVLLEDLFYNPELEDDTDKKLKSKVTKWLCDRLNQDYGSREEAKVNLLKQNPVVQQHEFELE